MRCLCALPATLCFHLQGRPLQQAVVSQLALVRRPHRCRQTEGAGAGGEEEEELAEHAHGEEEEEQAFSPERGNVAFGSAYDGWAFRIDQFAELYAGGWLCSSWLIGGGCCYQSFLHAKGRS